MIPTRFARIPTILGGVHATQSISNKPSYLSRKKCIYFTILTIYEYCHRIHYDPFNTMESFPQTN